MRQSVLSLSFASLALFSACGGGDSPGEEPPTYGCAGPATIELGNAALLAPLDEMKQSVHGVALPKGAAVDLGLRVYDAAGLECDPKDLVAASGDPALVALKREKGRWLATASRDMFDSGAEPMTTLSASVGSVGAEWPVKAVVSLDGLWTLSLDGLELGDFELRQTGRMLTQNARPEAGIIIGDVLTLNQEVRAPDGSSKIVLTGTIAPDRRRVTGTWKISEDARGSWSAAKIE